MYKKKKVDSPKTDTSASEENKKMLDLLVQLFESPFWPAILRYNRERDATVMQTLRSIDPFKETTQMARIQGIGIGLFDLESGVMQEIERRKKLAEEQVNDKTKNAKEKK